jgi:hypothetical protein
MIKVDMWMLVRDWIEARYDHIKVTSFNSDLPAAYPTGHLAKITFEKAGEEIDDIGFAAPKGVLVWRRGTGLNETDEEGNPAYVMFYSTDPEMFNKLDKVLGTYEPKRSK